MQREIKKRYWFAAGLFITASVAWLVAAGAFQRGDVQVTTAVVDAGPIVRHIVATGTLQAVRTVDVGAQVSDTIQSLDADFNSIVRKGQVLAKLDPTLIDAQLQQARAAEQQAEANVRAAQTEVEDAGTKLARAERLGAKALIQQSDLDAAVITKQSADADLKAAEAQVVEAKATWRRRRSASKHHHRVADWRHRSRRNVDVRRTVARVPGANALHDRDGSAHIRWEVMDESDVGAVEPRASRSRSSRIRTRRSKAPSRRCGCSRWPSRRQPRPPSAAARPHREPRPRSAPSSAMRR